MNSLMRGATIFNSIFMVAAMAVLLYFCANKQIVVADVAQDEITVKNIEEKVITHDHHIPIDRTKRNTNCFCVPLPTGMKAEDVVVENHYMDRELWVMIHHFDEQNMSDFYENNSVYGECDNVMDAHFELEENSISLCFGLNNIYEYKSILEEDTLYIEFMSPKEVYDKIVVIDAAYGKDDDGGMDSGLYGKNITLDIAKAVKAKMDEMDIKVYYTRMDDSNPSVDKRVQLASGSKADMYIRIEVNQSETTKLYGTEAVYNSRFFIPVFGSVELADLLERHVVTAISGKANGLVEAGDEDEAIVRATVPAATIRVGYITNKQENMLLAREDYIERIANGIFDTIMEAYNMN